MDATADVSGGDHPVRPWDGNEILGLGTPQMNLTFPSGSQPPGWIVPTGSTAEERNTAARNSVRDVML